MKKLLLALLLLPLGVMAQITDTKEPITELAFQAVTAKVYEYTSPETGRVWKYHAYVANSERRIMTYYMRSAEGTLLYANKFLYFKDSTNFVENFPK